MGWFFKKRIKITVRQFCIQAFAFLGHMVVDTLKELMSGDRFSSGFLSYLTKEQIEALREFVSKREQDIEREGELGAVFVLNSPWNLGIETVEPDNEDDIVDLGDFEDVIANDPVYKILMELYMFYFFLIDLAVQKEFGRGMGKALRDFLCMIHQEAGWDAVDVESLVDFAEERCAGYAEAFKKDPSLFWLGREVCLKILDLESPDILLVSFFSIKIPFVLKALSETSKQYEIQWP